MSQERVFVHPYFSPFPIHVLLPSPPCSCPPPLPSLFMFSSPPYSCPPPPPCSCPPLLPSLFMSSSPPRSCPPPPLLPVHVLLPFPPCSCSPPSPPSLSTIPLTSLFHHFPHLPFTFLSLPPPLCPPTSLLSGIGSHSPSPQNPVHSGLSSEACLP